MWFKFNPLQPVNAQCNFTQGTEGVSRPKGKLPGVPFLTLKAPSRNLNSLTIKLEIHNITLYSILKLEIHNITLYRIHCILLYL